MDQYDEDLTQNPFFQTLQIKFSQLFDEVTNQRHVICIPRAGSLEGFDTSRTDIENHILLPLEGKTTVYATFNNKEVNIKSGILTTGAGFEETRTETFFNENDESYRVLCISHPLEGGEDISHDEVPSDRILPLVSFQTLEECAEMLWGSTGNTKIQKYLDDLMCLFLKNLSKLENAPLRHVIDASQKFYAKAFDIVMKDQMLKKTSKNNNTFMDNLRIATETYIMHGVYRKLFKTICTCLAAKDSHLNKITRNLTQELQLRDMGVRMEFCQNVPRARKEIAGMCRYTTPLGKLSCLKRVVSALMRKTGSTESMPLTTDDLLPILVFLVVKADMPNWCANFVYMTNFRFSGSNSDDEYGFYLATLEAALEHVSSGQLCDIELSCDVSKPFQLSTSPKGDETRSKKEESDSSNVEKLFRFVKDDNRDAINELLGKAKKTPTPTPSPSSPGGRLCHPLCTCERCAQIQAQRSLRHSAPLTIHSRDDKGWTVMHIAAYYGHILMTDILLQIGAVVNACDYHGTTPLHVACQHGHQAVALLLLHYNAGLNLHDTDGYTALHLATVNGHEDCVKALVYSDQGSGLLDLDAANDFGDTAVHLAAKWGHIAIIELLIENGARVLIRNRKNRLPVHAAHNWKIQHMLTDTAEKEVQNRVETAAKVSIRRHSTPVSSSPIVPPSNPVRPTIEHSPIISKPERKKSFSARRVSSVSEEIREPSATDKKLEKLLKAIADGDIHMTKLHLGWTNESDDDEDDVDLSQKPLCHPLCQCEKCQPVQKFTSATDFGIHLNICNQHGRTPLHVASLHGHELLVELFLKRGAQVDARNYSHQSTPLHLATKQDNMKVVELLVFHGAEVNAKDSQGNSPLHYSVVNGCTERTLFLIQRGAKVNIANKRGNTPLHEAVKWNFDRVVSVLVRHGADTKMLNRQNLTPEDLAQTEDIVQILRTNIRKQRSSSTTSRASSSIITTHKSSDPNNTNSTDEDLTSHVNSERDEQSLRQVIDSIEDFETHQRLRRSDTIHGDETSLFTASRGGKKSLPRSKTIDKVESEVFVDSVGSDWKVTEPRDDLFRQTPGAQSDDAINGDLNNREADDSEADFNVSEGSTGAGRNRSELEAPRQEKVENTERISSDLYQSTAQEKPESDLSNKKVLENISNYICESQTSMDKETDCPGDETSPAISSDLSHTDKHRQGQKTTDLPTSKCPKDANDFNEIKHESLTEISGESDADGKQEKSYFSGAPTDKPHSEADSDLDSEDSTTESQKDLLMEEKSDS